MQIEDTGGIRTVLAEVPSARSRAVTRDELHRQGDCPVRQAWRAEVPALWQSRNTLSAA
jgi:hypothetical protein